jgi:phage tail-like protein
MAPALRKQCLIWSLAIERALFALFASFVFALPVSELATAAPGGDALTAARFELSIDGHSLASFSELQGITTSVDVVEPASQPPRRSLTVVLKRGMTRNIEMSAWHELVLLGDIAAARRNIAIIAYAHDGKPVARYNLTAAWPSKMNISTSKAGSSELLLETVTITCEFIQRVPV